MSNLFLSNYEIYSVQNGTKQLTLSFRLKYIRTSGPYNNIKYGILFNDNNFSVDDIIRVFKLFIVKYVASLNHLFNQLGHIFP